VEQSVGEQADWKAVDAALVQAASLAKEVAPYRHTRLAAVRIAGGYRPSTPRQSSSNLAGLKVRSGLGSWRGMRAGDEARELHAPVYSWFTEGSTHSI
jgi:hypothetical protein